MQSAAQAGTNSTGACPNVFCLPVCDSSGSLSRRAYGNFET
ncbi:hypothetical protein RSSM_02663 [Rhodopirellula sallentina SM41]|uniref:Uncharacterized protein n=1 Tax=Rhodopirellula sallentina SM41 TaxID=1263870 RepID=M5U3P5_9BACT|nr:hypothetical protein RSSM_02663 [Rhodopirellula sallentina SM41]